MQIKFRSRLFAALLCFSPVLALAQQVNLKWTDILSPDNVKIEGYASGMGTHPYVRLWTNAKSLSVRIVAKNHWRAATAQCLLYQLDDDGKWLAYNGEQRERGGDTIMQSFSQITRQERTPLREMEYRLFLPAGIGLQQISFGVDSQSLFKLMPLQPEKRIVVYQDNASAAGHNWADELERRLDRSMTVLSDFQLFTKAAAQPGTRIALLEIKGQPQRMVVAAVKKLQKAGIKTLIFSSSATKDRDAFEQQVRQALNESKGALSTLNPVVQSRDRNYNWRQRHADELALIKTHPPRNVVLANSIIHYWGGPPQSTIVRGQDSWETYFSLLGLQNMGFGWDRIENVLWRVQHDELDGFKAEHVLLMIGTNNLQYNTDQEIIEGLRQLIFAVKSRQPQTRILISGIFPRRKMEERVAGVNQLIEQLAGETKITFINPGKVFLDDAGKIKEACFVGDGLHPNQTGYRMLAPLIAQALKDNR
ncbi:lysophospholipase L1-like esterase [Mucilaginibacter yixingensis]|uniref:Lysophospholipase L1-like esterase n=1 Tax=Mucilaginibacter yixingensis TaxID=1295612 RepID=A0A2T5JGE6_9SPHI|nr:GDSL-type esterase/lipase family protein [Mucilaginibacter yixingensis]PTR01512.1 lysophospholipase L1-like esterase [Mucilaginibacter yixingensis]